MELKYFVKFNPDGRPEKTYVADNSPYSVSGIIRECPEAIEVSPGNFRKLNTGYVYKNGKFIKPKENFELMQEEKLAELKHRKANELQKTDHQMLEYLEFDDKASLGYINLRKERNGIRKKYADYEDMVRACKTVEDLKRLNF